MRLEEDFAGNTCIFASLENNTTKAVLSPGQNGVSAILWSEADELAVFMDGNTQKVPFILSEGAGTKQAVFKGVGSGRKYVAFYPAKMVSSLAGDSVWISLPVEQTYQEGTFANGVFPMLASGNSPDLTFSNLASILRLSITGKHKVTRIVFKSALSSIKVCGQATASVASKQLSVTSSGRDSLVLTVPGVQLSETQPTDFYMVLPPQTYHGGFTVRVYTNERYMDKTITTDFTMVRSQIHKADPFVFKPNGVDVSTTLKGGGSEADPFLIESLGDLLLMQEAVNGAEMINGVSATEAFFMLTADIDLSRVCGAASNRSWTPIGSPDNAFMGTFDGAGHAIRGLYISNDGKWQGLFGLVGSSDFKIHKGCIRDLTVSGNVKAAECVGLIAGEVGRIEYCNARGIVEGTRDNSFCGGLVGSAHNILFCRNEATVKGKCYVGGVAGDSSAEVRNCINLGDVSASAYSGGILGYQNAGNLYNCVNEGVIRGDIYVGGITGYNRQAAKTANCINKGSVNGTGDYVGGLVGYVDDPAFLFNCVNIGTVAQSYGSTSTLGGVCGYNAGEVKQNYWLFESGQGIEVGIGSQGEYGASSANKPLSSAQMKGADCGEPLFKSYSLLLDALNGWAAHHKTASIEYSGWQFIQEGAFPSFTNKEAQFPGDEKAVFHVSASSVEISSAYSGSFELKVTSSLEYSTSLPEWISLVAERRYELDPDTKLYTYSVGPNDTGIDRYGEVVFTNSEGTSKTVRIKQAYYFLTCDASELVFSASGGVRRFNISSSIPWTVQSDASWCVASPDSGIEGASVSIRTEANKSEIARSASIKVSSVDGSISYSIAVVQGGKMPEDEVAADWKEYPFVHQSVAMRFTATWCGWCPMMNKSIKRAQELYPGHIQQVALHEGESDLRFSKVNPLISQFSISGYPTGVIDGRMQIGNYEIESAAKMMVEYVKETETTYGTVTGAEITSSLSGREASVSVGVYLKKAGDYKITVLLLEDGIVNPQSDNLDGYNSQYVHDCVARVAMSDVLGDAFGAASDYTVQRFNYAATIPNGFDINNMRVMVIIQRTYGSYPKKQNGSFGDYFIDNCATVELGGSLKLALEGAPSGGGGGEGNTGDDNEGIIPGGDIDM